MQCFPRAKRTITCTLGVPIYEPIPAPHKAPTRQLHTKYTHCCLLKWPHQQTNQFIRRCHPPIHVARKPASQTVPSRMQLTLHATRRTSHGASRLLQAMSAWSVKTRGAPSRHLYTGRVHGHTTTAMHGMGTALFFHPHVYQVW